jgi:hypothetical protein
MNMRGDIVAIDRASYEAFARNDRAAIERLIGEDFHFTSPLRNTEIVQVRGGQIVDVEVYFGWSIPHRALPGVCPIGHR